MPGCAAVAGPTRSHAMARAMPTRTPRPATPGRSSAAEPVRGCGVRCAKSHDLGRRASTASSPRSSGNETSSRSPARCSSRAGTAPPMTLALLAVLVDHRRSSRSAKHDALGSWVGNFDEAVMHAARRGAADGHRARVLGLCSDARKRQGRGHPARQSHWAAGGESCFLRQHYVVRLRGSRRRALCGYRCR
jgi:hypothetical protein